LSSSTKAPLLGPNRLASLVEDLAGNGFAVARDALSSSLVADLRAEALMLAEKDALREARIGRGLREVKARSVRQASISWLDGRSEAQRSFLAGCEDLRLAINRRLFAGLFEFEAHYAVYPQGGFYAPHLDAFGPAPVPASRAGFGRTAGRSRVVSLVTFLNETWHEDDGGALAIWRDAPLNEGGRLDLTRLSGTVPDALIQPEGGTLVLMLSEHIPHEVRPTARQRLGLAGWFRVNASIGGLVDPLN
jgi:SM-20-related protein